MPAFTFRPYQHIRKSAEFSRIQSSGLRFASKAFVVFCQHYQQLPEDTTQYAQCRRLGVVASRRVGPAVKRNYGKRIVREVFRRNQDKFVSYCDIIVILRANFDQYSYEEIENALLKAWKYAKILL